MRRLPRRLTPPRNDELRIDLLMYINYTRRFTSTNRTIWRVLTMDLSSIPSNWYSLRGICNYAFVSNNRKTMKADQMEVEQIIDRGDKIEVKTTKGSIMKSFRNPPGAKRPSFDSFANAFNMLMMLNEGYTCELIADETKPVEDIMAALAQ